MIEFQAVSITYRSASGQETTVFSALDLTIADGEFFCVIGPSGCGKTTLLNMIAGFVQPTSGVVLANGEPILEPGADRGCVFQEYSLFPWLTVEQNIEFGLRNCGVPAPERQVLVNQHLDMINLGEARHKYPFELSGGMQQRVGIARALINRPDVLLMDEPFAALDAITRTAMQREMLTLWQTIGTTVFYITHNIEEAIFLGTRVAVMSSRPATIAKIIDVDIEHPRERSGSRFNGIYRELETTLYAHIDAGVERKAS